MSKKIKVLIIVGSMCVGGIQNQVMHLLRQADKNKFQIDFTSTEPHPFYRDEIEALGGRCITIPATEGKHFLRYCKAIYRVMKDGGYDIVHSHELFHSGMVLLTARLAGVKQRMVHAHNWADGVSLNEKAGIKRKLYNRTMQKLIQWNGTEFLACSSLAGEYLYGKRITEKSNYHLVFNSVDTRKFLDHYDDEETGELCDDWINVIQVGRFSEVKNQLFTVEIAKTLRSCGKKIRILCVGNDGNDYEKRVREAIRENGHEDRMLLLGIRKDVDVLMRKSKAFLLPSEYEGMPLVLIEAQASGLPCVVADTFSHEVDFGIGSVDWLKLEQGADAWAEAVVQAVSKDRADKASVVKAIESSGFDSAIFAKKLCDIYERSVNG